MCVIWKKKRICYIIWKKYIKYVFYEKERKYSKANPCNLIKTQRGRHNPYYRVQNIYDKPK